MLYRVTNPTELNDCVAQVFYPSPTKTFDVYVQGDRQGYTYADHLRVNASGRFYNNAAFAEFDRTVRNIYASMAAPMVIGYESIQNYADSDWPASILALPDLLLKQGITRFWNVYVSVFDSSIPNVRNMGNRQIFAMIDAGDLQMGLHLRDTWFRWDLTIEDVHAELGY